MTKTLPTSESIEQAIGRRVRAALKAHPSLRTQAALARRSGVSPTSVNRVVNGEVDPTASTLLDLAAALEVPVEELLRNDAPGGVSEGPAPASDVGFITPRQRRTLSSVQQAFLDMAIRYLVSGELNDKACIDLMHAWANTAR